MDFIETGKLPCDQVKFFVLDEAGEPLWRLLNSPPGFAAVARPGFSTAHAGLHARVRSAC